MKRITVFSGHYGSGKTNVALSVALGLARSGQSVTVADLDIVNPYFRTKDSARELEKAGIELICSDYANTNVDIPALPQSMYAITDDRSRKVVVDLGGDDRGALALGRLAPAMLEENDFDLFAVINMFRPLTKENIGGEEFFSQPNQFTGLKPDTTSTRGRKLVGIINREPRKTADIIRTFYIEAINSANDSIKLVNPYLTLNHKLKKALKNAIKRGVKVEIMISQKSDIPLTPDCVFYNAHKLMKHGADIWVYQPGFHHTKIIMVDGQFCTVGSANLNARSLRWDYEENAVILDSCTTSELSRMFDNDKTKSLYLTEKLWDEMRSPWKKFVGWFAHLLAPFL